MIEASSVFRPNPVVAIEDFGDRSLALHCVDLRLIELNATARDFIARLDGQASLEAVAAAIADEYGQPLEAVLPDLQETTAQLIELDIVERVSAAEETPLARTAERPIAEGAIMPAENTTRYVANPDVSCREEGPDGALLFNPDTDDVLVVNITGLLIWEALAEPRTREEVTAALVEQCNNAPEEQVAQDVGEFVEQLIGKGFVGVYQGAIT